MAHLRTIVPALGAHRNAEATYAVLRDLCASKLAPLGFASFEQGGMGKAASFRRPGRGIQLIYDLREFGFFLDIVDPGPPTRLVEHFIPKHDAQNSDQEQLILRVTSALEAYVQSLGSH